MSSATASPLPSSAQGSTSTHEPSNHHVVSIVATIVPVVVIVCMIVWGLLIAGGLVSYPRHGASSQPEATSTDYEKGGVDQVEPVMWEVCLKPGMTKGDVLPLAVELRRDKVSIPLSRGHTPKPPTIDAKSKWRPILPASRSDVSLVTKPAQTTVVVMMPTPPPRSPAAPVQPEYAIGTRHVVFTEEGDEDEEEEDVVQEKPVLTDHAALVMDVRLYGYFVA